MEGGKDAVASQDSLGSDSSSVTWFNTTNLLSLWGIFCSLRLSIVSIRFLRPLFSLDLRIELFVGVELSVFTSNKSVLSDIFGLCWNVGVVDVLAVAVLTDPKLALEDDVVVVVTVTAVADVVVGEVVITETTDVDTDVVEALVELLVVATVSTLGAEVEPLSSYISVLFSEPTK